MTGPLFSVICPTYQRAPFLKEALRSVATQSVDDFECIVVDDAGGGDMPVPDGRFRVVRRGRNGGPAAARNTGLAEAIGRYVAFIDDDDVFSPRRLQIALDGLQQAPVTVCFISAYGKPGGVSGRMLCGDVQATILDQTTPPLGATAVARDVVLSFDESYDSVEDVEWWLRTAHKNRIQTVATVGYYHRSHDGPRVRTGLEARLSGSYRLLDEHHDYFAAHPAAAAFRWLRIGIMAGRLGKKRQAARAFVRSFILQPRPRTIYRCARTLAPNAKHC